MDPFETYDEVSRIANGGGTKTSEKIVFNVDFSGGNGLREALSDLLIPFSTSGAVSTSTGRWGNQKCSLCSNTTEWDKMLQSISEEDKKQARDDLSKNLIPVSALRTIATPAPFGKGDKTVLDTNVRKAFEIPAASLPNKLFPVDAPPDQKIVENIESTMKPGNVTWKYKLYKMHIYDKGGKFAPHVDTLHADNHVATLVAGLPGSYEGGQLVVKQEDKELTYDLSSGKMQLKWAAFYTDCTHEVVEVSEGCRVVLQYDIYEEKDEDTKAAADDKAEEKDDEEEDDDEDDEDEDFELDYYFNQDIPSNLKSSWKADSFVHAVAESLKRGSKDHGVGLLMRHRYSLGSLNSTTLKGIDRFIYEAVTSSGQFDVALTGLVLSATSEEGQYKKDEVSVNAISMSDFDSTAAPLEFPCKTAKLFLDSEGRERVDHLKYEGYIEHTGNEAQEGSMSYHFCAFVIAAKLEDDEKKRSDEEGDKDAEGKKEEEKDSSKPEGRKEEEEKKRSNEEEDKDQEDQKRLKAK